MHDIEPNGSFVEVNKSFQPYIIGVSTDRITRNRCGSVRVSDTGSDSKDLAKIKTKNDCGISLKLKGHKTSGPHFDTLNEVYYTTDDGITLRYIPHYKGVNIVIEIANPSTALNVYRFTLKEYGCDYTYEDTPDGIHCISSTGVDDVFIKATYVVAGDGDYGIISVCKGEIVNGYQEIIKTISPVWLGNAVAPVKADPSVTIDDIIGTLKDNRLLSTVINNNYGGSSVLQIQYDGTSKRNTLMSVDLTNYPDITVTSAKFGVDFYSITGTNNFDYYKVLVDWVEGVSNGIFEAGASSWRYTASPTQWTSFGCTGVGTDHAAVKDGSAVSSGNNNDFPIPLTNALAQDWIDNPGDNHGIVMLKPAEEVGANISMRSSESVGNEPYFYMEYTEDGVVAGGFPFFFDAGHY